MKPSNAKAIVLNLGDGMTTGLGYLLPMVLQHGNFDAKSLLIGGVGGATSMAFNLDDSEDGKGTKAEFVLAFLSSLCGGVLPVVPFILFPRPFASLQAVEIVLAGIGVLYLVKSRQQPRKQAIKQVLRSFLPAIVIVCALSLI